MKYIVVSDIHSNYHALSAVLEHAKNKYGADAKFISLGDMFGIGAMPSETLLSIYDNFHDVVVSYSDKVVLDKTEYNSIPPLEKETIEWTINKLEDSALLKGLRQQVFITKVVGEKVLSFAHCNFHDNRTPIESLQEVMSNIGGSDVVFVGGTHIPMAYTISKNTEIKAIKPHTTVDEHTIELGDSRALINVGSVGNSRDGSLKASYVFFDSSTGEVVFNKVQYPNDLHISKMQQNYFNSELILRAMAGR
jgi:predicted phosphodiesterase